MTEQYSARPHPEQVVLEIGEEVGALVVYTRPDMHGTEIEISRVGEARTGAHKEVLNRPVGGRTVYAAVFDQLGHGSYTLWSGDRALQTGVAVAGGRITELDWRSLQGLELAVHDHSHHDHVH